ncbi:hypothetical protein ACEZCY_14050 [Streptacidiphilus sp. N1-12]|uniref:Uncharacterized protein n=2 Tax=Streptacidiphilus alkalitolerans TaxID=3342712 RepID=A0ABV6WE70_9ACTN
MDTPSELYLANHLATLLPGLPGESPDGLMPEGRSWIDQLLDTEWTHIEQWGAGADRWDSWPDDALAHHNSPDLYGLAVHTPGLTTVHGYRSRTARDADTHAVHRHWISTPPTD